MATTGDAQGGKTPAERRVDIPAIPTSSGTVRVVDENARRLREWGPKIQVVTRRRAQS